MEGTMIAITDTVEAPEIPAELVDYLGRLVRMAEIPALMGVRLITVKMWRTNQLKRAAGEQTSPLITMPDPVDFPPALDRIIRDPFWDRNVLLRWGRQTGRLDLDDHPIRIAPVGRRRAA
jgi:hypothetical protein